MFKKIALAALAASVATAPALAAPFGGWNNHDRGSHSYRGHDHGSRFDNHRFGRWDNGSRFKYRSWQRGQRFDSRYAYNYRVISNPRYYRLHDAPRGYRWVQSGNDAVLVGLTTGLIAAVMANMIH
jgi:Ni/Co efflux regulator RcnB